MAYYQCRGYVRSVSSDRDKVFITISANSRYNCKKNQVVITPASTIYNVFMEIKGLPGQNLINKELTSLSEISDSHKTIVIPEDNLIPVHNNLLNKFNGFDADYETESTFIISDEAEKAEEVKKVKRSFDYHLVYFQMGPENSGD